MTWNGLWLVLAAVLLPLFLCAPAGGESAATPIAGRVTSLDSRDAWSAAPDPADAGKSHRWFDAPRPGARPVRVPGTMQEVLGEYHGVAWYWRTVALPAARRSDERRFLRFWSVDYAAEVWVNGSPVGRGECADTRFDLDITAASRPGERNLIAVRIVNPTDHPIDGMVIGETPGRNRSARWGIGGTYNAGGIQDSVELICAGPVRIADLYARPDPSSGEIQARITLDGGPHAPKRATLILAVSEASGGGTIDATRRSITVAPGVSTVEASVRVEAPHLWHPSSPHLYRLTARIETPEWLDESTAKCGFRDFRFANGYFRLNGRRIFLKSAHFGGDSPLTGIVPFDPDMVRRDFLNLKTMGFNMARCIAGLGRRHVMDLADEIGLMVYDESYAAWCMQPSPQMAARWDRSVAGMIQRDRNHPSVVIWGLLNETADGPVFRHAAASLPYLKRLDDLRVFMLNSGRWDNQLSERPGTSGKAILPESWGPSAGLSVPFVACNRTGADVMHDGTVFPSGALAMHVGSAGEPAALRFTAPADGAWSVALHVRGIAGPPANGPVATASVRLFAAGRLLFKGGINCDGQPNALSHTGTVTVKRGDPLTLLAGSANATFNSDTVAVDLTLTGPDGAAHNAGAEWSNEPGHGGPWSYGQLPSATAGPEAFRAAAVASRGIPTNVGSLSNPGAPDWQDMLADKHPYQPCPHTASVIRTLRTMDGGGRPLLVSEYGFGSANNLLHLLGHYSQVDVGYAYDRAALTRIFAEQFSTDWSRWGLAERFGNMESYFRQCIAMEAAGRLLGTSAIRSNPNVVGHSLTACHDTVMAAEGLITSFREPKPGVHDAMYDAWSPVRFCAFADAVHLWRGGTVRIEVVLIDEDVLKPGKYPVRIQVLGPGSFRALDTAVEVEVKSTADRPEPPFARAIFADDVRTDGPAGAYRVSVFFERGAAAEGGEYSFWVHDPAARPPAMSPIVLWGADADLAAWCASRGIAARPFAADQSEREVILVGKSAGDWTELARHIARGSRAVFLCPAVFARGSDTTAMLPLTGKGQLISVDDWLYQNNDWAKEHPIFSGLPDGLLDYQYYREILGNRFWSGQQASAEAVSGMINTSLGYASGLTLCTHELGAGRFTLNSLLIRENLSGAASHPVAERLLRNLLAHASKGLSAPPAPLPDRFDEQLRAIGYR